MASLYIFGECRDRQGEYLFGVMITAAGQGVIGNPVAYTGGDGAFFIEVQVEAIYDCRLMAYLEGYTFAPADGYRYRSGFPLPPYPEFIEIVVAPSAGGVAAGIGRTRFGAGMSHRQRYG